MSSHQIRLEPISLSNGSNTDKALMVVPEHAQIHDVTLAVDTAMTIGAFNETANVTGWRAGVAGTQGALGQAILNGATLAAAEPWMLAPTAQGPFVWMNDVLFFRWAQGSTGLAFPGGVARVTLGPRYAPGPARPRMQVHIPATAAATGRTAYAVNIVDEPCRILGAYFVPDSYFSPTVDVVLGLALYRNQGTQAGSVVPDQVLGYHLSPSNKPVYAGELLSFSGVEAEQPVGPGDTIMLTYTQGASTQALPSGHVVIVLSDALDARDLRPSMVAHSRYPAWTSAANARNEQVISVVEQHGYLTALHLAVDATATLTNAGNLFINLKKHRGTQVAGDGALGTFAFTASQVLTQGYPVHGQTAYPILELEPGDVIYASYLQGSSGQALGAGAITLDIESPSGGGVAYGGGYQRPNGQLHYIYGGGHPKADGQLHYIYGGGYRQGGPSSDAQLHQIYGGGYRRPNGQLHYI